MVTVTTEIRGKECAKETLYFGGDVGKAWCFARCIERDDPFQWLGAPNLVSAAELIAPTLDLDYGAPPQAAIIDGEPSFQLYQFTR